MKAADIIIDYIHFHYVQKDRTKPLPSPVSGGVETISPDLHRIYSDFVLDIIAKRPSSKTYDIFESDPSAKDSTKSLILKMLRRPIPQEKKQFTDSASLLARKLIRFMPGSAKSGVLFQILFRVGGIRYLCFLKLAWVDQTWSEYDAALEKLELKELIQRLPARGRPQKGAIFPHPEIPSSAYMKVCQLDYPEANYFEKFLGGMPEVTGGDQMDELRRVAVVGAGRNLTFDEEMGLYEGLEDHLGQTRRGVDSRDVVRIAQDALPSIPRGTLKTRIQDEVKITGIIRASQVADLKVTFNVGNITLVGPYIDVLDHFHAGKKGSDKHTIEGRITGVRRWKR